MAKSGDRCDAEGCNGRYIVYSSFTQGPSHIMYLQCNCCKHKPGGKHKGENKIVSLAESVRRRSRIS